MTTPTPAGAIWPARLAYTAAAIFAAASAGTNLIYGWQKGTDLGSSLVWVAVSLAVSIVFSLSWPALLRCLDAKQWSRAVMVFVALLTTGGYSVTAALGSAMGGRANAAMAEKDAADRKAKAQASWDAAKAELDALVDATPAAELQRFIEATRAELSKLPTSRSVAELESLIRRGCGSTAALAGHVRSPCPRYEAERGIAWERQRLANKIEELGKEAMRVERRVGEQREKAKAAIDSAAAKLAKTGSARVANSDAVALAAYLQALGLNIDADRVNKLLALLAVLVIECGGGLSLAVGLSLSAMPDTDMSRRTHEGRTPADTKAGHQVASPRVPKTKAVSGFPPAPDRDALGVSGVRLLAHIRGRGGVLSGGQRGMAQDIGWSKTRLHEVLHELARAGMVQLQIDKTGTVVQLLAS